MQRRSNARLLLVWRDKVVCDVFDEDSLALVERSVPLFVQKFPTVLEPAPDACLWQVRKPVR